METLTDQMEDKIREVMDTVESAGGMYKAVQEGIVQTRIGESALRFQRSLDTGEQTLVGVNAYESEGVEPPVAVLERPNKESVTQYLEGLDAYKQSRDTPAVARALDELATAANSERQNVYAAVVTAATAGGNPR